MRIIFNTSFIVDEQIEDEWIHFMRRHYITPLQENNLCDDIIFTKVSIDQPEGRTYSLQLVFSSPGQQEYALTEWLPAIEQKLILRYRNKYMCFSSALTEI